MTLLHYLHRHRVRALILGAALFACPLVLRAQGGSEPDLLVTWQAHTYAPPGYQGKVLPALGTPVDAALEFVENGALVDLSHEEVRWFLNENLLRGGLGLAQITFRIPVISTSEQVLRATVVGYQGADRERSVIIPVVAPRAVIDAAAPRNEIPKDGTVSLRAFPYFFTSSFGNLTFSWKANGKEPEEAGNRPDELILRVAGGLSGGEIELGLHITNRGNALEFAGSAIRLRIP